MIVGYENLHVIASVEQFKNRWNSALVAAPQWNLNPNPSSLLQGRIDHKSSANAFRPLVHDRQAKARERRSAQRFAIEADAVVSDRRHDPPVPT
jgi:hypothetical protein